MLIDMLIDESNCSWVIDTVCAALSTSGISEQSEALQLLVTVAYMYVNSMHICPMAYESLNHVWSIVFGSKVQRGQFLHEGQHTLS